MFSKLRRVLIALSIIAASSAAVKVAYAAEADGTVDLTYGSSGITSFAGNYRNALALSDGKMVAFANVDVNSDYNPDKVEIKRFTTAGALDTSFGMSGTMTIQPANHTYVQYGYSFADASGGFYLVYSSNDPNETGQNAGKMIKITSAGVQDLNFGTAGTAVLPAPAGGQNIGGHWIDATSNKMYTIQYGNVTAILRQNADGTPDTTFGLYNSPYISWPYSNPCTEFWRSGKNSIWVDPTESFAYVASFISGPNSKKALAMAKFSFSTSSCDPTFGGDVLDNSSGSRTPDGTPDGYVEYTLNNATTLYGNFTFATDGSLYTVATDDTANLNVVKLDTSGALDTSFNGTGISANLWSSFSAGYSGNPILFLLPNNVVRLVGDPQSGSGIARIAALTGGVLDSSFGNAGLATTPSCQSLNFMGANRLSDGSIIVNSVMGTGYPAVYDTYFIKLGSGGSSSQCGTTTTTTQPNYGGGGGGGSCTGGATISPSSTTGYGTVGNSMSLSGPTPAGYTVAPTFSISGVPLPDGLTLNAQTGAVTGTPTASSYASVIINVASGAQSCQYNIMFSISSSGGPPPSCTIGAPTSSNTAVTFDTSFGSGGSLSMGDSSNDVGPATGTVTRSGQILVAATASLKASPYTGSVRLVRYNVDGSLDTSFGTNGIGGFNVSSTQNVMPSIVTELSDGSIVVAGINNVFGVSTSRAAVVMKFSSNGILDTSFGTNGILTLDSASSPGFVSPGKMISVGDSVLVMYVDFAGSTSTTKIAKISSTGSLDSSFGTSGTLTLSGSGADLADGPSGTFLVAGTSSAATPDATVTKYTSTGSLDTSFGTSGVATVDTSTLSETGVSASVVNGKIMVGVKVRTSASGQAASFSANLVRLNADGSVDSGFGTSGVATVYSGTLAMARAKFTSNGSGILTLSSSGASSSVVFVAADGTPLAGSATTPINASGGACAASKFDLLPVGSSVFFVATNYPSESVPKSWVMKASVAGVDLTAGGSTPDSGSTPVADTPSTPATPVADTPSTPATTAAAPTLVTTENAAALVRTPGSQSIIVNGEEVVIESKTVSIPASRTPADYRTPAQVASIQQAGAALLQQFLASLPAGATSNVVVVNTATGAVMQNLVFDANGNSVNVPVEDIVFLDGPQLSLMIGSNNANITADGKYQVGAGGIVGVTGAGLGAGVSGEVVAMSTPTLLANFQTTAAGDFNKSATLPESIGVGDHTLVVAAGTTYAMMGIRVVPAALPTTGGSSERVIIIALFTLVFGALFFRGRRISLI